MVFEGKLNRSDGINLYYRVLTPNGTPKASVIVVHGMGDHSGGLISLLESLRKQDFIVYAMDNRGHGQSTGNRGFIREWEEFTEDLNAFCTLVKKEQPDQPVFLVGHSLGGLISADYSLEENADIDGLVMIAPAISYALTSFEKMMINILGKIKPDFKLAKSGDISLLTSDLDAIKRINEDTLRHNHVTPGLGRGMMQALARVFNRAHTIQIPLLMQYGLLDGLTPPGKMRTFFESAGSEDKQRVEYENMKHRPFEDIGKEQFFDDLTGWLNKQVEKKLIKSDTF